MNRLQKRAWYELQGVIGAIVIAGAGFGIMVHCDAKGVFIMMICLILTAVFILASSIENMKILNKFDERERKIYQRADNISTSVFMGVVACFVFITFFTVGGKGRIAVHLLPAMLLGGIFFSQLVKSALILFQCATEENDG
jgi:hypothetical protein